MGKEKLRKNKETNERENNSTILVFEVTAEVESDHSGVPTRIKDIRSNDGIGSVQLANPVNQLKQRGQQETRQQSDRKTHAICFSFHSFDLHSSPQKNRPGFWTKNKCGCVVVSTSSCLECIQVQKLFPVCKCCSFQGIRHDMISVKTLV